MVSTLKLKKSGFATVFIMFMLLTLGAGLFAPRQASAAIYTTANGKSCKQRVFSTGSRSVCVSYLISLMNASGKISSANKLTPGVNFGPRTKAAVQEFQNDANAKGGADGIVGPNTWAKLCSLGKSGASSAWTKAGCSGQNTDIYRSKPVSTASKPDYRWGYFNCYPTSKTYPNKPVWACERKWVLKSQTVNDGGGVYALKSQHNNVKKRHTQFGRDMKAYKISKSLKAAVGGEVNRFVTACQSIPGTVNHKVCKAKAV